MGLFGDDETQNERLEALEKHVRAVTEAVHANQIDTATCWAGLLRLQARVDEKISAGEVDPLFVDINEQLGTARKLIDESTTAATESWTTLQQGVDSALDTLRKSMTEAADRLQQTSK